MFIQHFTMFPSRVADPMRPGRTAEVGVLRPSGNTALSHESGTYEPDENGWIEVPHEVGVELCRFRNRGSGYYTPAEVDEQVRLGFVDVPVSGPGAKAKGPSARRQARIAQD